MTKLSFYLDLLERSAWTFVQSFCAFWITNEVVLDGEFPASDMLVAAAIAGGIAVMKGIVSTRLPWASPNDASSLPS